MTEIYSLQSIPYYDSKDQKYFKAILISPNPPNNSVLQKIITKSKNFGNSKLISFRSPQLCQNLLLNPNNLHSIANTNDLPIIFSWLGNAGFTIEPSLTNILISPGSQVRMNFPLIAFIKKN